MNSVQTFVGFANGRYIFGSTDGFLNYVRNPKYVECSNGTHRRETGSLPGRDRRSPDRCCSTCSRPASAASRVEEAGTQSIPQTEPAVFVQD